jgi:LDH2 family malate/lactate/ureidoglycolate dehydrogenase
MDLAILKARSFGIGFISARGSNHYGICGYYTLMAVQQHMIGFSCTNTSPLMAPTRSSVSALGTNPLSLAMGVGEQDQFVLDMATTTVALGKIELAERKGESIPEGWALDNIGKATTEPQKALQSYTLMPLGGKERNSGYKGYGLALMVEVLCGILSGSSYGPNIRKWSSANSAANLGQCFMAIDPSAFGIGSEERLAHLLHQLRSLPSTNDQSVNIPGDPERRAMKIVDEDGGITYHENQIISCNQIAEQLHVEPLKLCKKMCP